MAEKKVEPFHLAGQMCHRCERVVAILKRGLCLERGWHNIYTIKTLDRQHISSHISQPTYTVRCRFQKKPYTPSAPFRSRRKWPMRVSGIGPTFPLLFISRRWLRRWWQTTTGWESWGRADDEKRLEKLHTFNCTHALVESPKNRIIQTYNGPRNGRYRLILKSSRLLQLSSLPSHTHFSTFDTMK